MTMSRQASTTQPGTRRRVPDPCDPCPAVRRAFGPVGPRRRRRHPGRLRVVVRGIDHLLHAAIAGHGGSGGTAAADPGGAAGTQCPGASGPSPPSTGRPSRCRIPPRARPRSPTPRPPPSTRPCRRQPPSVTVGSCITAFGKPTSARRPRTRTFGGPVTATTVSITQPDVGKLHRRVRWVRRRSAGAAGDRGTTRDGSGGGSAVRRAAPGRPGGDFRGAAPDSSGRASGTGHRGERIDGDGRRDRTRRTKKTSSVVVTLTSSTTFTERIERHRPPIWPWASAPAPSVRPARPGRSRLDSITISTPGANGCTDRVRRLPGWCRWQDPVRAQGAPVPEPVGRRMPTILPSPIVGVRSVGDRRSAPVGAGSRPDRDGSRPSGSAWSCCCWWRPWWPGS